MSPGPAGAPAAGDTRERILRESASLFAQRGYVGTSTREISRAVGISQPSLFHHFPSKQAIVESLLVQDLLPATALAARLAGQEGPAAPRLYAYILHDTGVLLSSPYQLGGLYTDDVMQAPEFAVHRRRRKQLHAAIADMVGQGVESSEFVDVDPNFVQRVVTSVNMLAIDAGRGRRGPPGALPAQAADFVLRALLTRASDLSRVRKRAAVVLAELVESDGAPRARRRPM